MIRTSDNNSYVNQNPVVAEAAGEYGVKTISENAGVITYDYDFTKASVAKDTKIVAKNGTYFISDLGMYIHAANDVSIKENNSTKYLYTRNGDIIDFGVPTGYSGSFEIIAIDGNGGSGRYYQLYDENGNIINNDDGTDKAYSYFKNGSHREPETYNPIILFDSKYIYSTMIDSSEFTYVKLGCVGGDIKLHKVQITLTPIQKIEVTSITSTDGDMELTVGSSHPLNYTVEPSNYTDSLTWSSTASDVVSVDNGVIIAHKNGEATVTVTADSGESKSWNITVPEVHATSIELDRESYEGYLNDSFTLIETVLPEGSSDPISWESSNEAVATVVDGVVELVGEGEATITVSTNGYSDTCQVKCNVRKTTSVEFAVDEMNVEVWDTFELKATVLPENTQETPTYKSSDETIATVENGIVTTLKEGEVIITCESGEFSDEIKLVVGEASLSFSNSTGDMDFLSPSEENKGTYYVNGFRLFSNKPASGRAQVKDIEFNLSKAGTISFTYYESGNKKIREAQLTDSLGNVIKTVSGATGDKGGSVELKLEVFLNPGLYTFTNIEMDTKSENYLNSTYVNLVSISFVEANEQLYYQYDNDAAPTAIRFIGTIEVADVTTINTITLSFKLDGNDANKVVNITTLYTSVANTFEAVEGTYYVCHAITGIGSALTHEFEVTMTVEYADETVVSVTRSFTLGVNE